jgi:hypothetical protein
MKSARRPGGPHWRDLVTVARLNGRPSYRVDFVWLFLVQRIFDRVRPRLSCRRPSYQVHNVQQMHLSCSRTGWDSAVLCDQTLAALQNMNHEVCISHICFKEGCVRPRFPFMWLSELISAHSSLTFLEHLAWHWKSPLCTAAAATRCILCEYNAFNGTMCCTASTS